MAEHRMLKAEELEVGMEVAYPIYAQYGWNRAFRKPIWMASTIESMTPKHTKVRLANGRLIEREKLCGEWYSKLYAIDGEMKKETESAEHFKTCRDSVYYMRELPLEKVARLSDKELAEVDKHFAEIVKIIEAKE